MKKTWKIKAKIKSKSPKKRREEIIKVLLKNRGIKTKKDREEFFKSPNPTKIPLEKTSISSAQVKKAIKRIRKAKRNKELVIIYGDYDADGVTATAIMWETLYGLGINAMPFIPEREAHGHGLKKEGIDDILKLYKNPKLIITVDNGITAFSGAKYCKKQGIDLIVCDHHQIRKQPVTSYQLPVTSYQPEKKNSKLETGDWRLEAKDSGNWKLPTVLAVVHSDKLAGAGVAWFFAREILKNCHEPFATSHELLQLAAIGTIADVFPLIGINRSIVTHGLEALKKTKRIGIKALLAEAQVTKKDITTYTIGFIIAPRLNAMGRLAQAMDSLRLLCTKDEGRGVKLAFELGQTNKDRQDLTFSSFEHAVESSKLKVPAKGRSASGRKAQKLIFLSHESYEQGVVGLVAGKLAERFHRPAIVVAKRKKHSKGSARSIRGFNIIEALREFEDDFVGLGGHPRAAGFTVATEKLPEIQQKMENLAMEQIPDELLSPILEIDCEIFFGDITEELYKEIEKFEPFGFGNAKPKFLTKNVQVVEARQVGKEGKHLKLKLATSYQLPATSYFDGIFFGKGELFERLNYRKPIDIVFNIDENEWNGKKSLQLVVKDLSGSSYA